MPRQARIDIPGLLQHVIVRGVARSDIFFNDRDRENFVQRLSLLLAETGTDCFAWALLDNHVHMLLLPVEQPLASLMRRLLTGYAVAFNLRHNRAGHLFQNRYKSIVCDSDVYLLELVRYIHLNPLRAGIVDNLTGLAGYRWCGHGQLLGSNGYQLINADKLLSLFATRKKAAVVHYLRFLADGLQQEKSLKLSQGGRLASQACDSTLHDDDRYDERVLGGGDFVDRVVGSARSDADRALPLDKLVSIVADYCGIAAEELSWTCRQPAIVRAKALICFLATRRCRIAGIEVAARLGYSAPAVSRAARRGQRLFAEDESLRRLLEKLNL